MSRADCQLAANRLIQVSNEGERMQAIRNPPEAAEFAASIIRRHVPDPAYRVFLFGSRATGSAGKRSDIDIGIEGPAPVPHAVLAAIQDELDEAPTLYTIDVVDFMRVPETFRRIAHRRIAL
jgi:predicted nucleotidyltransferase